MRAAVTALAPMPVIVPQPEEATEADAPPHRAASHYLWAMFLARIYETLPLVCPVCQSQMRTALMRRLVVTNNLETTVAHQPSIVTRFNDIPRLIHFWVISKSCIKALGTLPNIVTRRLKPFCVSY